MPSLTRTRTILTTLLTVLVVSLLVTQSAWAELSSFTNNTPGLVSNVGGITLIMPRDVTVSGFDAGETVTKVTITVDFHKVNHEDPATCDGPSSGNGTSSQNLRLRLVRNPAGPGATPVTLVTNQGTTTYFGTASNGRVVVTFDDAAATAASGTPTSGTFRPANPLSAFNGLVANAIWRLEIGDAVDDNQGVCFYSYTLNIWGANDAPIAVADTYTATEDIPLTVAAPGVLGNDTDADANPLTAVLVTNVPAAAGSVALNADGSFTYTPLANFNGATSFTYRANDGTVDGNIVTVTLNVTAVNDPPVADNDAYTTNEDLPLTILPPGVLDGDTDVEGSALTAAIVANVPAAAGSVALNPNGSFTYTPADNFNGPTSFTYQANDGTDNSNTATVSLTVTAVNDPPVADNDAYTTNEDLPLTILPPGVLDGDTDVEGSALTAAIVANVPAAAGSVTLNPNGSFTYTPADNFNGPTSFTYQANDGTDNSNTATVSLTVTAINDPPTANNDAYTTDEDVLLTIAAPGVIGNDTDIDGGPLTATLVVGPAHGLFTFPGDGSFNYGPDLDYVGGDTFTYRVNDGTADSNIATVTITVGAVNDAPVAVDDSYLTDEDTPLTVDAPGGVLSNDTDTESNPLTAARIAGPANGTVTLNTDGSFTYMPALDFAGDDTFTYQANDGLADSNVATVTITVGAVNDAPVAVDDAYGTNEDTPLTIPAPGVLANDTDAEANPLSTTLQDYPLSGSLTLNNDGSFTYTPNLDFTGDDTFTYYVFDGASDSNIATVTITVAPVNDAPVAVNDTYNTIQDTPLTIVAPGVIENDTDAEGDPLAAAVAVGPTNGTLTLNADGSFTYTPNAGWSGVETFSYTANDGTADSNIATVTIGVGVIVVGDQTPVAAEDAYTTEQDTTLTVDALTGVLVNDVDPNSDPLTAVRGDDPAHGGLVFNPDGSFVYYPDAGFFGVDTFTYQATDGTHFSELATVTITVTESGQSFNPGGMRARDDVLITGRDTPGVTTIGALFANDTLPADALMTGFSQAQNGTVENVDDQIIYTPNKDFTGQDAFTYTVSDSLGGSVQATVYITVWKPVPACRDIGGEPNSAVYATVPNAALPTGADVFCRVLVQNGEFVRPAAEIGIPEVLALNILQAVEVFGLHVDGADAPVVSINGPVTICLQGVGKTLYLNVAGQPRTPQWTESWQNSYLTCTTIPNAGTVILVN